MQKILINGNIKNNLLPYSPCLRVGDFIFIAGQGPINTETDEVIGNTIEEQTEYTLSNIKKLIESAGAKVNDIVKVNAYLTNAENFDKFNKIYGTFFSPPFPVRTTVIVGLLDILVEIDAIAISPI
ncbi:MAG: RidA family protein [Ignavibacteriaceae bacterium]